MDRSHNTLLQVVAANDGWLSIIQLLHFPSAFLPPFFFFFWLRLIALMHACEHTSETVFTPIKPVLMSNAVLNNAWTCGLYRSLNIWLVLLWNAVQGSAAAFSSHQSRPAFFIYVRFIFSTPKPSNLHRWTDEIGKKNNRVKTNNETWAMIKLKDLCKKKALSV